MSIAHKKNRARPAKVVIAAFVTLMTVASLALLMGCGAGGTTTTRPDSTTGTASPPAASEDMAPDFSGVTLEGLDVSLSEYRGKPLVLAFMASW